MAIRTEPTSRNRVVRLPAKITWHLIISAHNFNIYLIHGEPMDDTDFQLGFCEESLIYQIDVCRLFRDHETNDLAKKSLDTLRSTLRRNYLLDFSAIPIARWIFLSIVIRFFGRFLNFLAFLRTLSKSSKACLRPKSGDRESFSAFFQS